MQEKKMLFRKEDRKERKTVESYACMCGCDCSCNPCDSSPSTAYLTRKNKITTVSQGVDRSVIYFG